MTIVSTTITNSRPDVIAAALKSIEPHVDLCIVIDTGACDATLSAAHAAVGDKLRVVEWAWRDDFAAARNNTLEVAFDIFGAEAAFAVDTDESIHLNGLDLRQVLAEQPDKSVFMLHHESGSFKHYRFFRRGVEGKWLGRVHEAFRCDPAVIGQLPGAFFRLQPRPNEDLTAKFTGYKRMLRLSIDEEPTCARWWYYMGDTCAILKDQDGALAAWNRCVELNDWPAQSAWACFKAASLLQVSDPSAAMQWIIKGLIKQPKLPELHWLGGVVSLNIGDIENAIHFSRFAVKCGMYEGQVNSAPGFTFPPARWELPFQTLFAAHLSRGEKELADQAGESFIKAQQARVARNGQ